MPAPPAAFSRAGWERDFAQLKDAMSDHYANLQWAVERRGLDLLMLSNETSQQLAAATSDAEARRAITAFLAAFGDGHLGVRWPAATKPAATAHGGVLTACARLGFRSSPQAAGLAFDRARGFRQLITPESPYFPIGVLNMKDFGPVGVLRIALFDARPFPELCEEAAAALGLNTSQPCSDGCAGPLEREALNLLTVRLERQIDALRRERVRALMIDLTSNGGGSNWVGPAARVLTAKRLVEPRQGFIRHEHWVRQFADRLASVRADAQAVPPRYRPLMDRAAAAYERALSAARQPCERRVMWAGGTPPCSLVSTEGPLYTSGVLPYAARGSTPPNVSCCYLFGTHRFTYREGYYSGRLLVLVDRETASAAEYFAAILQDNGAATIVGEPTYGAGCGYTNGGIPTVLRHSGGAVRMPDCVRLRADGSNEVEGITPDILIPWRTKDSELQRARRLEERLGRSLMGHAR